MAAGLSPGHIGGMYTFLASMSASSPHGGLCVYRSADTDMLGWVCERAAGVRMADLISTLIWQQIGAEFEAEITCDGVGSAIHDGGMSATARDIARFGQMLLDDGYVAGVPVLPNRWLVHSRTLDPDIRWAFASSGSEATLSGGWYRNPVLVRAGAAQGSRVPWVFTVRWWSSTGRPKCRSRCRRGRQPSGRPTCWTPSGISPPPAAILPDCPARATNVPPHSPDRSAWSRAASAARAE